MTLEQAYQIQEAISQEQVEIDQEIEEKEPKISEITVPNYVAVSTLRNEEEFIRKTLDSLFGQTMKPSLVVIIDDDSDDDTPAILSEYPIIMIKHEQKRFHLASYNMQRSLMLGVEKINELCPDWKYLFKFDGDIFLNQRDYVERLLNLMEDHPKCGVCSGNIKGGKVWTGRAVDGAKIFRRECWDDIGGLDRIVHWDTHALLKAYHKGWQVNCFRDHEYTELRTSERQSLYEWYITGLTRFHLGFTLYHTIGVGLVYLRKSPLVVGSLVMIITHIIQVLRRRGRPFHESYYAFMRKFSYWETLARVKVIINTFRGKRGCGSFTHPQT